MTITKEQYNEKMNNCYVPESNDGIIEKKAVLGNQKVERIFVPYGITVIGDWAFAHCLRLKEIWLPDTVKELGRDIFQDDRLIEIIYIYSKNDNEAQNKDFDGFYVCDEMSGLAAVAVKCFEKSDILRQAICFNKVNSENQNQKNSFDSAEKKWIDYFDEALEEYIKKSDDSGFNPFLAGGEEDYEDPENDIEYYKKNQRIKKCGAIFERFKYKDINNSYNSVFNDYIKANKEEALDYITYNKQESYHLLKLYADRGFIEESDMDNLFERFSGDDYIECKAYLIKFKEDNFGNKDIWENFKI